MLDPLYICASAAASPLVIRDLPALFPQLGVVLEDLDVLVVLYQIQSLEGATLDPLGLLMVDCRMLLAQMPGNVSLRLPQLGVRRAMEHRAH